VRLKPKPRLDAMRPRPKLNCEAEVSYYEVKARDVA